MGKFSEETNEDKPDKAEKKDISVRLAKVFDALNQKPTAIAERIGLGAQNAIKLYNVINGKSDPSWKTLEQLVKEYPNINFEYLAKGIGQPLIDIEVEEDEELSTREFSYIDVPFISIKALATFKSNYDPDFIQETQETYPVYGLDQKTAEYCYVLEVEGNSMAPKITNGMKVLVRLEDPNNWCYASGVYAVFFKNFFVIKRIKRNQLMTIGTMELHSDAYENDFHIVRKEDLRNMLKLIRYVDGSIE